VRDLLLGNMAEAFRIRISVNNEEDLSITMTITITGVIEDPTIIVVVEDPTITVAIIVGAGGTRISKIAAGGPEAHLSRIGGTWQRSNPRWVKAMGPSMAAAGWRNEEPSKS
jgi:hypothetical protein